MIEKLAQKISRYFVSMQVASEDNREVIAYGLFHILSDAIQIIVLVITAWLFKNPLYILAFTLHFISLKGYAGGAHAKYHWSCLFSFTAIAQGICVFCQWFPWDLTPFLPVSMSALALLLVIYKAPVVHPNNPKPVRKIKQFRKLAILVAITQLILILTACLIFPEGIGYILAGSFGELSAAITLILPISSGREVTL